ncbi:MAG TPA: hypothetical protein DCY25_00095 [Bacteroidales bacterium]|nr:hypothetical protein [Bacteroidales bacterium]
MIPIKLTIQGLYSYQEKQTIDFTKLTAAHLFGIFGIVGSGKSTILEAITFAIYGKTDRLNQSGDNRYYNMMNLKANELLIDFIFETGKDQMSYRATVRGKRNSKNFEDVKTLERTAYQKSGESWIPIEMNELERAIGLSYDNFKRTIIIPQGQFQEFLQLGNKDRTQMMKELFNLGKYEFFHKVTSLESKNNDSSLVIKTKLNQLGDVHPDRLTEYRAQLEQLGNDLKEMDEGLSVLQKEEEEYRKLSDLMIRKDAAEKRMQSLHEEEPEFRKLEHKIARYEQCVNQFKFLLERWKQNKKALAIRENQIGEEEQKLILHDEEIKTLTMRLDELNPAYQKREELRQKSEEMGKLVQIKDLEKKLANEEVRFTKGDGLCRDLEKKLESLSNEKNKLEGQLRELKVKLPDLKLLAEVKAWHVERDQLEKQVVEVTKAISKSDLALEEVGKEKGALLVESRLQHLSGAGYTEILLKLKEKAEVLRRNLKGLQQQEDHLRVKAKLKEYSDDLMEGDPCPLCGSLHHPGIFREGDIDEAIASLGTERKSFEKEMELISGWMGQITLQEGKLKMIRDQQDELNQKKLGIHNSIGEHDLKFVWDKYQVKSDLEEAFREADRIQKEIGATQETLDELVKNQEKESANLRKYQLELDKIRNTITGFKSESSTLLRQLKVVNPDSYLKAGPEQLETERSALLDKFNDLELSFGNLNRQMGEKNKVRDTLQGSLQSNRNELTKEKQTQSELDQQMMDQLEKSQFVSMDEVAVILSEVFDPQAERLRLSQFRDNFTRNQSLLDQLQKEVGTRVYFPEKHQELSVKLAGMKEQITSKNQEQGSIKELCNKLVKDLESQAELYKELERLDLRAANLKTMKSLFKASGFVNYISSVYLQNLCSSANDRFFQLTRQKLSLEITPDNNFQIRDYMNGGKVRSVKTLSGGQTFQAALCLALALADNIQKITESNQNFFFLDEGFGSLDKETLDVVFDTLKSLRKENRIVGVISHVEEMQQEIDVHLRIRNHEERGSLIETSWTV